MLICEELQKKLRQVNGVIIEYKRLTLSVHYRLVQEKEICKVKEAMELVMKKYDSVVAACGGKKVLEVRPRVSWNKGGVSLSLLKSVGGNVLPIYVGDDKTDEDAFRVLKEGITILVSERKRGSNAKYFVRNTLEVQDFLNKLLIEEILFEVSIAKY